jgi:hypothetical protein
MRRALLVLAAAAVIAGTGASRTTASYPRPERACGSILSGGKPVAVDIDEVGGGMKLSCSAARGVMSRYLAIARRHRWPGGTGSGRRLIYESLRFDCYKSRPDRVGWDYHCNTSNFSNGDRFVDVGAGRRGRLCSSRSRRCPPG